MLRSPIFPGSLALVLGVLACGETASPIPSPPDGTPAASHGSASPPPSGTNDNGNTPPATSAPVTPGSPAPPSTPSIPASLHDNRDRLIDSLAAVKGVARCALWQSLTPTQRGVFLTITDLLGKRSYLTNPPPNGAPRVGPDLEMALDHVTKVYEIRDSNGQNGGGDNNRIWVQVDTKLITAMRSFDAGLPEWGKSSDWGGAHEPFDGTSETATGQPRGQSQFWSDDAKSVALTRPGVEGINDPHIVEIDIDYNLFHDSNPEGDYWPDGKGSEHYAKVWSDKGLGTGPELDYVPTTCTQ